MKQGWLANYYMVSGRWLPLPVVFRIHATLQREPDRKIVIELDAKEARIMRDSLTAHLDKLALNEVKQS